MKNGFSTHYYDPKPSRGDAETLRPCREEIAQLASQRTGEYTSSLHSLRLPRDASMLAEVQHLAKRANTSQLKYAIIIGIGGSNLGAKAIYDALRGTFDLLEHKRPKLLFLDTISGEALASITEIIERDVQYQEEIAINLISKSGATTESVVNFELLYEVLEARFPDIHERIVVTTDHGSPLWNVSEQKKFGLLPIPKAVGGRYSVFSPVGLFPLMLAGIDVRELCEGAADALDNAASLDTGNNAVRNAETLYSAMDRGHSILNIFHFNPALESLGKWERQLIAESLGKERDNKGKVVHTGITPIVSIGSTDLHSMAQLYIGGPRDKYTMFVHAKESYPRRVPKQPETGKLVAGIGGKSPSDIMDAILKGVMGAYEKHELPYCDVHLASITPYTLGAYMEWRMATTIYLAKLMHVDPFDQPNVEDYKKVTRSILENSN